MMHIFILLSSYQTLAELLFWLPTDKRTVKLAVDWHLDKEKDKG